MKNKMNNCPICEKKIIIPKFCMGIMVCEKCSEKDINKNINVLATKYPGNKLTQLMLKQ